MTPRLSSGKGWTPHGIREIKRLCPRDLRWLQALSDGARMAELSPELSVQYVKNRVASIRWLLGARNTTQAVAMALRKGIIR